MGYKAFRSSEKGTLIDVTSSIKRVEGRKAGLVFNEKDVRQRFQGFGGALTEASCYVLSLMSQEQRNEVLHGYYSQDGLNYVLGRVAIHSCDFSLGSYDYLQGEDKSLASFSLEHEEKYVLPVLRSIKAIKGQPLALFASPWSPCAFMKDNHQMTEGGHLLKEYYPLWAVYESKYLLAMKEKGFPISFLSIQNEPAAVQVWESCVYSSKEEGEYALVLRKVLDGKGLQDVKLYLWDHNRDIIIERIRDSFAVPGVLEAIDGIAYHWYCSEAFDNVARVHAQYPTKHLLFSEGCIEGNQGATVFGQFSSAERYARNIIGDLNAGAEGWIDWNVVLDQRGGPNHVGNYCEAPIQYDEKSMIVTYNPSYYGIAHFAHFFVPDGHIIGSQNALPLKALGYLNPNGSLSIVVLNDGEKDCSAFFRIANEGYFTLFPRHSITTIVMAGQKPL